MLPNGIWLSSAGEQEQALDRFGNLGTGLCPLLLTPCSVLLSGLKFGGARVNNTAGSRPWMWCIPHLDQTSTEFGADRRLFVAWCQVGCLPTLRNESMLGAMTNP